MKTSKGRIVFLLITIVLLTAVAYVLYTEPELPAWFAGADEPVPPVSNDPIVDDPIVDDPIVDDPIPDNPTVDNPIVDDPIVNDPTTPDDPPVNEPQQPLEPIVTVSGDAYTYDVMSKQLRALAARYPDLLRVSSYGTSADGRELYVATLGAPDAGRQIIVTAGMHAREYVNCYVVMRQLEYYLENYDTGTYDGKTYRELFSKVNIVLAPMTNPDGVTLAQQGLGALASDELREQVEDIVRSIHNGSVDAYLKNNWKSNARGVDVNRNFDILWEQYVMRSSNGEPNPRYLVPSFKEYKGSAPETEPEAAALVALTKGLSNPVASVCVHSQGNLIYWRCDPDSALWAENRRLAELTHSITGYLIIDENQTDAQTEPSYSNWTVFALRIPTVTVENGTGGYPQTYDMADGFFECNRELWAAVALEYAQDK